MSRLGSPPALLLQMLVFFLAAVYSGSAIICHRSVCLDHRNITDCTINHDSKLVNCSDYADSEDAENSTACIKYSVTGATYRRMTGVNFSPCDTLEVKSCFLYHSNASMDLGGRLTEAMLFAGVNETVLDVHICHTDACNGARTSEPATAALLAAAMGALVYRSVRR